MERYAVLDVLMPELNSWILESGEVTSCSTNLPLHSSGDHHIYQITVYQLRAVQKLAIIDAFWMTTSVIVQFSGCRTMLQLLSFSTKGLIFIYHSKIIIK
jgi:hypothetical protein